jgi:hypothetical protein
VGDALVELLFDLAVGLGLELACLLDPLVGLRVVDVDQEDPRPGVDRALVLAAVESLLPLGQQIVDAPLALGVELRRGLGVQGDRASLVGRRGARRRRLFGRLRGGWRFGFHLLGGDLDRGGLLGDGLARGRLFGWLWGGWRFGYDVLGGDLDRSGFLGGGLAGRRLFSRLGGAGDRRFGLVTGSELEIGQLVQSARTRRRGLFPGRALGDPWRRLGWRDRSLRGGGWRLRSSRRCRVRSGLWRRRRSIAQTHVEVEIVELVDGRRLSCRGCLSSGFRWRRHRLVQRDPGRRRQVRELYGPLTGL